MVTAIRPGSAGTSNPKDTPRLPGDYAQYDFLERPQELGLRFSSIQSAFGYMDVVTSPKAHSTVFVMIHGINGSWMSWTPLLQALSGNSEMSDADLVVLDMRRMHLPVNEEELNQFGAFIINEVCGEWDLVNLVGHSFGGGLALHMAAKNPKRIKGVFLISASFLSLYSAARRNIPNPLSRNSIVRSAAQIRISSRLGDFAKLLVWFTYYSKTLPRFLGSVYRYPEKLTPRMLRTIPANFSPSNTRDLLSLVRGTDVESSFSDVNVPVRAIYGDSDPLATADDAIAMDALTQGTSQVIPSTGHCPHVERPQAAAQALFGVSAGNSAGPAGAH